MGLANRLSSRYEKASSFPEFTPRPMRWGSIELRRGRVEAAMAHFANVGQPTDAILSYWLHLLNGRALEKAERRAEAAASYRLAMADVPCAPSAVLALATVLAAERPLEASALASSLFDVPPQVDPCMSTISGLSSCAWYARRAQGFLTPMTNSLAGMTALLVISSLALVPAQSATAQFRSRTDLVTACPRAQQKPTGRRPCGY